MSSVAAPLKAVDAVDLISESHALATKTIQATDPYMGGHYPGFPIYPGVFTIESVIQTVRALLAPARVELIEVNAVRFIAPLLADDTVMVDVSTVPRPLPGVLRAKARCNKPDGTAVATATLTFQVAEEAPDGAPPQ